MDASTLKNNHSMNTMHAMFKILIGTLFEKRLVFRNFENLGEFPEL